MSTYAVNRLLQELFRVPGLLDRFRSQRSAVYDDYGLDAAARAGLDEGSPAALAAIGAHPILQMHYLLASQPEVAALISVDAYRTTGS